MNIFFIIHVFIGMKKNVHLNTVIKIGQRILELMLEFWFDNLVTMFLYLDWTTSVSTFIRH